MLQIILQNRMRTKKAKCTSWKLGSAAMNIFIDANKQQISKLWVVNLKCLRGVTRVAIHARGPGELSKYSLLVAKNSDCIQ
jgi:hypothetical protein